jgi:hypothetical protein
LEETEDLKFAPPGRLEKRAQNSYRTKRDLNLNGNIEFSMGLDESSREHFERNKRELEETEGLKFAPPGGGWKKGQKKTQIVLNGN